MSDRHEKWVRVEPGTVIPAGQPIRTEWNDGSSDRAAEQVSEFIQHAAHGVAWFIDSSWKPPLVLPTEPTWGIAVCPKPNGMDGVYDEPFAMVGRWAQYESGTLTRTHRDFQTRFDTIAADFITAFIPLTDEQIRRIEAAR